MKKNGIDARAFAEHLESLPQAERKKLIREYKKWIYDGAQAQGTIGGVGVVLFGGSLATPLFFIIGGSFSIPVFAVSALGAIAGFILARKGARQEREWRDANPFRY